MGKKQHQKDRLFISASEWKELGGKKESSGHQSDLRRLPFDHCALTFRPWQQPVCDQHGNVFELMHIIPYLQQHKKNPITSEPLAFRQLVKLHFKQNASGSYICPISFKIFGDHTHIVAIKTSGNVYCYEVVEELNIKAKHMEDLLTGEKFTRDDIINIQDPHHIKQIRPPTEEEQSTEQKQSSSSKPAPAPTFSSPTSATTPSVAPSTATSSPTTPAHAPARAMHSSGLYSGSFTSTSMTPVTSNTRRELTDAEKREQWYAQMRKKKGTRGYVSLQTNMGSIKLELYCDLAPRTCHNFLTLCKRDYYNRTKCHRLIPGFMSQWGDPLGTGAGGEGAFSSTFADEIHQSLHHTTRGTLSMANAGPNTNGSQFFITFGPASHLDGKHSIFGQVIGDLTPLDVIERVATGEEDMPMKLVCIEEMIVHADPFDGGYIAHDELTGRKEDAGEEEKKREVKEKEEGERRAWFSNPTGEVLALGSVQSESKEMERKKRKVVGGEIPLSLPTPTLSDADSSEKFKRLKQQSQAAAAKAKPAASGGFNFSNW